MATGSTASSGTEGHAPLDPPRPAGVGEATEPPAPQVAPGAAEPVSPGEGTALHDPARRAFFFQFGKQAVTAVGQVAGMADVVGRASSTLANELLGIEAPMPSRERSAFERSGPGTAPVVSTAAPAGDHAFRSAYRLAGDELVLLDQRGIPGSLAEVSAKRGSDVAYYLRLGVARGGPLMAQVAAYGLALSGAERAGQPREQRDLELRRTEQALVQARSSARLVVWATERMRRAVSALSDSTSGQEVAARLRAEADAIAADIQAWQAAIATTLAEQMPTPDDRPLSVLMHGGQGALSGGLVGSGLAALRRLLDDGHQVRVFVPEGRPFMDGARLASWELRQSGIAHQIIPDAAVAWLFEREPVDVVLLGAEWVAANGDVGTLLGGRAIAQLAAAAGSGPAHPRVIVSGLAATLDPNTPDGAAIPVELRPAHDLSAYLADVPIRASDALVPASDVVPAGVVDAWVTEEGITAVGASR